MNPPSPRDAYAREARSVPPARIALMLQPVVAVLTTASWLSLRPWLLDVHDAFQAGRPLPAPPPGDALASLASWLSFATVVFLAIWVARVTATGRALGSPARIPPWLAALGLFPFLSFFLFVLPYFGVAGSLPVEDPARRSVRRWWWAFVAQTLGQVLVVLLLLASEGLGIVGVVFSGLAGLAQAGFGERAVREVAAAHEHYTAADLPSEG